MDVYCQTAVFRCENPVTFTVIYGRIRQMIYTESFLAESTVGTGNPGGLALQRGLFPLHRSIRSGPWQAGSGSGSGLLRTCTTVRDTDNPPPSLCVSHLRLQPQHQPQSQPQLQLPFLRSPPSATYPRQHQTSAVSVRLPFFAAPTPTRLSAGAHYSLTRPRLSQLYHSTRPSGTARPP